MADSASSNIVLPEELQAKLNAAGVTDDESLRAALERDPALRAELEAALRANPQAMQAMAIQALMEQFAAVQDPEQMMAFYRSVPAEMEQPLMEAIENAIQNTPADADPAALENRRAKLADFRKICEQADVAQSLTPVQRAVVAFFQAPDEAAAKNLFAEQRALLQPYEAQQFLDGLAAQAPPETPAEVKQRLAERAALLRHLRGGAPQPTPTPGARSVSIGGDNNGPINTGTQTTFNNQHMSVGGNAYQAQTITITNVMNLTRQWSRPTPKPYPKELVVREEEIKKVTELIRQQGVVAIGSVKPNAVTMQGMPGVGKTMLAYVLANQLNTAYPDGVLWQDVGPAVRAREDARPILQKWAGMYVGDLTASGRDVEPDALRALINEHANLLVILDNVWSLEGVRPLREALPAQTHVIITTRSQEIMNAAGGGKYQVGLLSDADALNLVALRLDGWSPASAAERAWVDELIQRLGRHPLALDVALGLMHNEGLTAKDWQATAARVIEQVRQGTAFDTLKLSDEVDYEANVAAALWVSYQSLSQTAQAHYRALGAFAPEAEFSTALAAAVWGCDERTARGALTDLTRRALLDVTDPDTGMWRQHAVLRGYALALLRQTGEAEATAARHARACNAAMREADDAQRYYQMMPLYAQLTHAFGWAADNDLDLALDLTNVCRNMQTQFGKAGDGLAWAQKAVHTATTRGLPNQTAWAQFTFGNMLQAIATLPGEDRRERLGQALQAYDRALEHYRPDTAPLDYAATQDNRATLLSAIAALPGEDRRERLHQALQAYDLALQFRRPDTAPLDYAMTQNNRANLLSDIAALPGEDRRERLRQALQAYDLALQFRRPDTAPLAYAATQNNRANLLSAIAALPGEDRRERLLQALQAYDLALEHYRPDTAPLAYAATQNNRANLLSEIATLAGEDRRERLGQALEAYDLALQFRRPDTAPLDYAMTQNNRATLLSDIAALPGEDRRERLRQALQAYDLALQFRRPDTAPLDYAATQNNRANRLSDIAALPGEDRPARLRQALEAYDRALEHYRPDTAPLDYAMTQNNRATLLSAIAALPGEDRRERLRQALQAYDLALQFRRPDTAPLDYAATQNNRANRLSDIAALPGEDRPARLRQALEAYDRALDHYRPDTAPLAYAMTQGNLLNLYQEMANLPGENKKNWLIKACQAGWKALTGFQQTQHGEYEERIKGMLNDLRQACGDAFEGLWVQAGLGEPPEWLLDQANPAEQLFNAFAQIQDDAQMLEFYQAMPAEMRTPFAQAIERFIAQAQQAGQKDAVEHFQARLDVFKQIQQMAETGEQSSQPNPLQAALSEYAAQTEAAQKAQNDPAAWQRAADAGEWVLSEAGKLPNAHGLEEWRANFVESLTSVYNTLGNALNESDKTQSLAAFERAIALQPGFAMYQRNRASTLIDLGRLDEAEQAIARARQLEPGAARLADLDKELAEARQKGDNA